MIENYLFRFNIKLVLAPGTTPKEGKILIFTRMCQTITLFYIKIMKFVANFEKSVLGF